MKAVQEHRGESPLRKLKAMCSVSDWGHVPYVPSALGGKSGQDWTVAKQLSPASTPFCLIQVESSQGIASSNGKSKRQMVRVPPSRVIVSSAE